MASSKDFEKIWEKYQALVKRQDVSIVDFCQYNGIVYSQFERWYKKHVGSVNVIPFSMCDSHDEPDSPVPASSCTIEEAESPSHSGVAYVNIKFSNGLKVCQENIDYRRLRDLVEKLEVLCWR